MKKSLTLISIAALALLGSLQLGAVDPASQTIMGEVIDVAGYAMRDAQGEEGRGAGRFRAEQGFPIGILTAEGEVFIAVYKNPAPASALEPANEALIDLMGQQVVARGRVYRARGASVIEIAIAGEM